MIIPLELLEALVLTALIWTAIAAIALGILFLKDCREDNIW